MKVPISSLTGKPMKVIYTPDTMEYRGEKYECVCISFIDEDGESYTTTESDGVWYSQVTNQYRERYGVPYVDEIIALRERYGLSASKMSTILGFGINQYRLYEDGEVPSESNGKKQGEITCFDMAYILFADEENIPCLHFGLYDKKELMHGHQLVETSRFVGAHPNIQFVASILYDKLPDELKDEKYFVVKLSPDDKLFRF